LSKKAGVLLEIRALDLLGKERTSRSNGLGLDWASRSTDQDWALGVLLDEWAVVSLGDRGLEEVNSDAKFAYSSRE